MKEQLNKVRRERVESKVHYRANSNKTPYVFPDEEKVNQAIIALNQKTSYNWFSQPFQNGFKVTCIFYGAHVNITEYVH